MKPIRLNLTITDLNDSNRREKFAAATEQLAKAMNMPVTIRPKADDSVPEEFAYQAQADFTDELNLQFAALMDQAYHAACEYLELPMVKTFSKSFFDRLLHIKGKPMFNPETGRPLKQSDLDRLVKAIEKFLNLGMKDMAKKITFGSAALAKLLSFIEKTSSAEAARKMSLAKMREKNGHDFDRVSDSLKQFASDFKVSDDEMERLAVVEQRTGDKMADIAKDTVNLVKNTYYEAVIQKQPKGKVAQNLFDRFGDQNRDWRRVVETEHAEIFNNAYLKSEIAKSEAGEKLYFKRREIMDGHTCRYCAKIADKVVLWSDIPLEDEAIDDPYAKVAIWEGKSNYGRKAADYWVPVGTAHPHCRGSWERYIPPVEKNEFDDKIAALLEKRKQRESLYNEAIWELRNSKKYSSETTGEFEKELNSLYNAKLKAAGLI